MSTHSRWRILTHSSLFLRRGKSCERLEVWYVSFFYGVDGLERIFFPKSSFLFHNWLKLIFRVPLPEGSLPENEYVLRSSGWRHTRCVKRWNFFSPSTSSVHVISFCDKSLYRILRAMTKPSLFLQPWVYHTAVARLSSSHIRTISNDLYVVYFFLRCMWIEKALCCV